MASRTRTFFFTLLIYVAFFCSGASSLVAEVTWNRMLIVVVGNSLSATAMIIAVFMGGLGLGSFVGGRYFGRRKVNLLPYMTLELAIGLYVVLSPTLFKLLASLFTALAEGGASHTGLALSRIVVSLAALIIPAFLMGATYPAIVAGTALDSATRRTARTGYLYSINTLGAAIGCFAAGYHLLLEFGAQLTLNVALGLYVVAAACALLANALRQAQPDSEREVSSGDSGAATTDGRLRRYLYVATFGIGFVSLAYEVLLTRLSILFLGNSVSVFPLVLTAFLLGTGISAIAGTWLYGWLRRRGAGADRLFGLLALLSAAAMMLTPYLLLSDKVVGPERYARFADGAPFNPLPILGIMIAPTILIGALLPLAIRMLNPAGKGETTRGAAVLYTLNTIGGLVGAAVANHFFVPLIGIQGVLVGLTSILVAIVVSWPLLTAAPVRRVLVPVGTVAVSAAALMLLLPGMMHIYAAKIATATGDQTEVRFVQEGKAATVTVIDQNDPRKNVYRDMYLNGVEEASTRFWHVQLFKLLGILPPLIHESDGPKEAMVIAFGAGITAGSVLASDEVVSLDVADLNPDIEGINDLFTEVNGDVFHKDRFHFHNEDGRNFLATTGKQYDLIIGDSTHPRAYDSWILYTEEFYEAVARRLKPGGIFAQWVPVLGSMRGELMRVHLHTFSKVFPNATFWYVYGSDQAFLMATPEPFELNVDRLQEKLDRLPAWFRASEYQIDTIARIAGFFWLDASSMQAMIAGESRINTDGVHYFDKQSAVWPLAPRWQLPAFQTSLRPYLRGGISALNAAVDVEQRIAGHLARYGFFNSREDLENAFCMMPENGNCQYYMILETADDVPDADTFCQDREIASYRRMLASHPDNAVALNALASALTDAGRFEEALPFARQAVDLAPENGMILDTLGWLLHLMGDHSEALEFMRESDRLLPDHPVVMYHLGVVQHALGQDEEARANILRALEGAPEHPEKQRILQLLEELGS